MFEISSEETYQDQQIIFEEGSHGDWIYVVESGRVELFKNVRGESVVIDVLDPGEIFGELAFISGMPRTASARALGETQVGIFDRVQMDREFNKLSEGVPGRHQKPGHPPETGQAPWPWKEKAGEKTSGSTKC